MPNDKPRRNLFRSFPNKEVDRLRVLWLHKKSSAKVSLTFVDLNHSETMMLVIILVYSMATRQKGISHGRLISSITGNFITSNKYKGYWMGLLQKGYIEQFKRIGNEPGRKGEKFRISSKGKQAIDIYLSAQNEQSKKYMPKFKKPFTIAEYFSDLEP